MSICKKQRTPRVRIPAILMIGMACTSAMFAPKTAQAISPAGKEIPVVNEKASRRFVVEGQLDSTLNLALIVKFIATSKACRHDFNWIAGVADYPVVAVATTAQTKGDRYEANVALDHFLAGRCNWRPASIGVLVFDREDTLERQVGADSNTFDESTELALFEQSTYEHAKPGSGQRELKPFNLACARRLTPVRGPRCTYDYPRSGLRPVMSDDASELEVNIGLRER